MNVSITAEFFFSGCDYHPPSTSFGFEAAHDLLESLGVVDCSEYRVWLFRDLVLQLADKVAEDLDSLETDVRADVEVRLGHPNGVAPRTNDTSGSAELINA